MSKFDAVEFDGLRSRAPVVWAKAVNMRGLVSMTANGSPMRASRRERQNEAGTGGVGIRFTVRGQRRNDLRKPTTLVTARQS